MNTYSMRELTESQMAQVVGGDYLTWRTHQLYGNGSSGGGSGSSSNNPTYIHFGNSSNIGIIDLSNIYIGNNSNLIINFNQSAF